MVAQLVCAAAPRQVLLSLAGWPAGNLTIRTESAERVVPASLSGRVALVEFAVNDPLLDAMAFSRGRFALESSSGALYLPSYPEITRVIEDCR